MKKILITGRSLSIGGVEKSLLSLVNSLDKNEYEVHLLLMYPEGEYLQYISKDVCILESPIDFLWIDLPKDKVVECVFKLLKDPIKLFFFVKNIIWGVLHRNMAIARQRMWNDCCKYVPSLDGRYDVAYDFSGLLRRYVLEKVEASEKATWIHSDYKVFKYDKEIDSRLLERFQKIYCVSETCKSIFDQEFPNLAHKSEVRHNIIDVGMIMEQAQGIGFNDEFNGVRLLDITRLDPNKGLDIAVKVCRRLKDAGVDFRWYILGNDPLGYKADLERLIMKEGVEDCFILLGFTSNPYPYMHQADIIVHFSRFEGRSVAIDEALALNKIVLLTDYPTAKDQISHGVNGYICDFEEEKVFDQLFDLIKANCVCKKTRKG